LLEIMEMMRMMYGTPRTFWRAGDVHNKVQIQTNLKF
jgi:hypothetical protein